MYFNSAVKALFYNKTGKLVWKCSRDAKFEMANGTKAIRKGAVHGELRDSQGNVIERVDYR